MTDTTHAEAAMPGETLTEAPTPGEPVWVSAYQRWRPGHMVSIYSPITITVQYAHPNGKTVTANRGLSHVRRRTT